MKKYFYTGLMFGFLTVYGLAFFVVSGDIVLAQAGTGTPTPTSTATVPTATPFPGSVSGNVFEDLNGNGLREGNEAGVPGVTVTIRQLNPPPGQSQYVATTTSGSPDGFYIFLNVPVVFIYEVLISWPAGYIPTTAVQRIVPVDSSGLSGIDFGAQVAATATPTGTPTATPTATPTRTPVARNVQFEVDDDDINEGDCTDLKWQVSGDYTQVALDDDEGIDLVSANGDQEVCPDEDTTYSLVVTWSNGQVDIREVEVRVDEAGDTPVDTPVPAATVTPTPVGGGADVCQLTVEPVQDAVGQPFKVVGTGFQSSEAVAIGLAQPEGAIVGLPAQQANSAGSVAFSYSTKTGDQIGLYTFIAEGQQGLCRTSAAFYLDDAATPTPVAVVVMTGDGAGGAIPAAVTGGQISQATSLLVTEDPLLANIEVVALGGNTPAAISPGGELPGAGGQGRVPLTQGPGHGQGRIEGTVTNLTRRAAPDLAVPVRVNGWLLVYSGRGGEWNITGLGAGPYSVPARRNSQSLSRRHRRRPTGRQLR